MIVKTGKLEVKDESDGWREDIFHESLDDCVKRGSDDDTDREVHHISSKDKGSELFEHCHLSTLAQRPWTGLQLADFLRYASDRGAVDPPRT